MTNKEADLQIDIYEAFKDFIPKRIIDVKVYEDENDSNMWVVDCTVKLNKDLEV